MRKEVRTASARQSSQVAVSTCTDQEHLDPKTKAWLDNVIIPILLKELRQEWSLEKVA